ncbi:MAG: hypothetical protein A3K09_01510 [Nitrospinae bacterium RIFCSPLOWO2_12_FULL_47_7]|nr:MAG: hypothetical protein A3K09_01510 [Nitrospinae bacterium RIFCSPLOWO2_12_FULL_47_7]
MSGLLTEIKKYLPLRVYGKGAVLELLREMGCSVDKKTPLRVTDVFRSTESGELVCFIAMEGQENVTAALANLRLDITHPLFNKVRNYQREVEVELAKPEQDVNRSSFRVGDLYKKK